MKKLVTILVTVGFIVTTMAPTAVAGGHGHYRGHHHRSHVYLGHYHHFSGDHFWIGLGVGVLTGAIVSGLYHSPPPPRRVVYVDPQPVVVQRAPAVVVAPPRKFGTALPAKYGQVTVMPSALNLRNGPGTDYKITGTVNKDDVLDVIASEPRWFYVRTPDGSYGWVMDKYTRPAQPVG